MARCICADGCFYISGITGPSYKTVKGIAAALAEQAPADGSGHAFVRGAGYYGSLEGGE